MKDKPIHIPEFTSGLKWSDGWVLTGQSLYPPNSLGYNASTSPPNSQNAIGPKNSVDTYISAIPKFPLVDFESTVLTFDYPEAIANSSLLGNILVEVYVQDSCGHSYDSTLSGFYSRAFRPRSLQYVFAVPLKAISFFTINAWILDPESTQPRKQINFWADDSKFRLSKEPLRGCANCGYRGIEWCEYPGLSRVGAPESKF